MKDIEVILLVFYLVEALSFTIGYRLSVYEMQFMTVYEDEEEID